MRNTSGSIGVVGAAVVVASLSGAMAQQPAASQAPTATPAPAGNGKALFVKYGCSECHGLEGQGAPTSGPRVGPNPLPVAAFMRYVRSPRNQMPPYTDKIVSDQDLTDIHAYLVARAKPATTPLLPPEK